MGSSTELPPRTASRAAVRVRTTNPETSQSSPAGSRSRDDFGDLTDMFRVLSELDRDGPAYRRQRDAIIRRSLPLAANVAWRFRDRGEPHEDLVQVARIGLVKAVNRFDLTCGSDFIAFAVPTVMGEVRRHFRDHGWALKVPRRLKEVNLLLRSAGAELSQRLNRAPTASELAAHLGIDRGEVVEALIAANAYSTRTSELPTRLDPDDYTIVDRLGELDPNIEQVLDVQTVRPLLDALPDRERMIVVLRFFDNMTQSQIAERMGISQMHVSRLLARALDAMRQHLG